MIQLKFCVKPPDYEFALGWYDKIEPFFPDEKILKQFFPLYHFWFQNLQLSKFCLIFIIYFWPVVASHLDDDFNSLSEGEKKIKQLRDM